LRRAKPVSFRSSRPEVVEVVVDAAEAGTIIVSQLDYPNWLATLESGGSWTPVPVERVFGTRGAGAWQGVAIRGRGRYVLRLAYRDREMEVGLVGALIAWLLWFLAYWWLGRRGPSRRSGSALSGPAVGP
jgi:hypothetical protein